ncbi:MAG: thiamine pyrophosphate-dependent enzyme [archaeon]
MTDKAKFKTESQITWCPGCPNFCILDTAKTVLAKLCKEGHKQEDFSMATGIGCHAKIFDYLNISGIYGLHGRVIPTALGMKLGNPNLTVLGFAGDGDTFAEGIAHFVHACRYNADMTLIVHNNQSFSLTTGQSTPTSQQGFKNKAKPLGEFDKPLNPIKLALAAGGTFVARCNAKDMAHAAEILEKAIKHKGFAYVDIIQNCLIFNKEMNDLDKLMYKVPDNKDKKKAFQLADEWEYNTAKGKIPVGVIYQEKEPTMSEKWPQLSHQMKKKQK